MRDDLDLRDLHGRHEPDPAFRRELRRRVEAIAAGGPLLAAETDLNDDEEDLIMLTDTRTEEPAEKPRARRWYLAAAAAAVVVAVGAAVVTTTDNDDNDGDSTITAGNDVVFHDAFDDESGRWDGVDDIRTEGGQQIWTISTLGQREFTRPLAVDERIVDTEVTAEVGSTDPDSTVGVYCRKGANNQDFYYYFRLGPSGAVIGVLPPESGSPAEVLATAPDVASPIGPFTLAARCVDTAGEARLELLLDGEVVVEATHDAPLPAGFGALEVQAGPAGSAPSEVHWDDFTVSALG